MTVLEEMRARAFAEFDRMLADRELQFRNALWLDGQRREDRERVIARWLEGMASVRARIPGDVAISLMKVGVPLDVEAPE